jgi:hypothetical protein
MERDRDQHVALGRWDGSDHLNEYKAPGTVSRWGKQVANPRSPRRLCAMITIDNGVLYSTKPYYTVQYSTTVQQIERLLAGGISGGKQVLYTARHSKATVRYSKRYSSTYLNLVPHTT